MIIFCDTTGRQTDHCKPEDQLALENANKSLTLIDGQYCISVPWGNKIRAELKDNYTMALKRLQNTEKQLEKKSGPGDILQWRS